MRLKETEWQEHLRRPEGLVYALFSDDAFLLAEAEHALLESWRKTGFSTHQRLYQQDQPWELLVTERDSIPLFSESRVVVLRIDSLKIVKEGSAAIQYWLGSPPRDTRLLLLGPRPDASAQKNAWFQALDRHKGTGVFLAYPPNAQEWPRWVSRRLQDAGLAAGPEAIQMLADLSAGQLFVCQQAIQRLVQSHPGQHIGLEEIRGILGDSSLFSISDLTDATLRGETARVLRILQRIRQGNTEPVLVLWALHRDLTLLLKIQDGHPADVMRQERVFPPRSSWLSDASRRLPPKFLWERIGDCIQIDAGIKGQKPTPVWSSLEDLALCIAVGPR